MKNLNLTVLAMVIAWLAFGMNVSAQNNVPDDKREHLSLVPLDKNARTPGNGCMGIPGLSDEQRATIDKLRTEHFNKVSQLHAQLREQHEQLRSLRTADNPQTDEINSVIDKIAALRAELMKEREAHRQAIRAGLDADQKAWFDSRQERRNKRGDRTEFNRPADCRYKNDQQNPDGRRRYRHWRQ
jgi:Spy/CpxP family protein refolding chaperone